MKSHRIPSDRPIRFDEVAALLDPFGQQHLDPELTGFTLTMRSAAAPENHRALHEIEVR